MSFYIYNGPGADKECATATYLKIISTPSRRCELIDSIEKLVDIMTCTAVPGTIVIPGGNALELGLEHLLHAQALMISQAVRERGWNYLGICAGAILGTGKFQLDEQAEINFPTPTFDLLPVTARAYRMGIFSYEAPGAIIKSRDVKVQMAEHAEPFDIKWIQGPALIPRVGDDSVTIVARYAEYHFCAPCAVTGKSGLGKVSLVSVHPELSAPSDKKATDLFEQLIAHVDPSE